MFGFLKRAQLCCVCGGRSTGARYAYKTDCICDSCFDKLERTPERSMFEGTRELDFVSAPFYYNDTYRNVFLSFKFGGNAALGHIIGKAAGDYFARHEVLKEYDAMVPVPLTREGKCRRGFNQAEVLARYFSEACGVPVINALVRRSETVPQSTLSGAERVKNVMGAFEVCENVDGMRILVADDLFTTGSTMNECAKTLKAAGALCAAGVAAACVMARRGGH